MALIKCKECGKEISDTVKKCPNCGVKIEKGKKVNKKYIVIGIIVAIVILSSIVISNIIIRNNEKTRKEEIFDNAKISYKNLNDVTDYCIKIMDSEYNAWYYGIFNNDDATVSGLATKTGLSSTTIKEELNKLGYTTSSTQNSFLREGFSYCILIVNSVYETKGTFTEINEKLEQVKSTLKIMGDEYSDYEHYPKLKEYYSKVCSYYEFVKSPTGSFNQLQGTINDYENNLRTYKNDLQYIFE